MYTGMDELFYKCENYNIFHLIKLSLLRIVCRTQNIVSD